MNESLDGIMCNFQSLAVELAHLIESEQLLGIFQKKQVFYVYNMVDI